MTNSDSHSVATSYFKSLEWRRRDGEVMRDLLWSARGKHIDAKDVVLDIGCGPPEASQRLWAEKPPQRLVGIDIVKQYGEHPFWWDHRNRMFKGHGFFKEVEDLKQESDRFDVIWSCFSAHIITAEYSGEPTKQLTSPKVLSFFRGIADLLKTDGVFACQVPAVNNFFPAIIHLTQRVFHNLALDFQRYRAVRNKYYSFWPNFEELRPMVEAAGLEILLDTSMSSWRLLEADQSFHTWWSANIRILEEMDLSDQQSCFHDEWILAFQDSISKRELPFSEKQNKALGCLHARILLIQHKGNKPKSFKPSDSYPIRAYHQCQQAGSNTHRTIRIESQEEREVPFKHNDFEFEKYHEAAIGALVCHEYFRDRALYCMALISDEIYRVFFNQAYENDNKLRQILLSRIKEQKGKIPFKRISPQLSDNTGVISWFVSDLHKYAHYILHPGPLPRFHIINLISIHSFSTDLTIDLSNESPVSDILLDACTERGFVSLISHGIKHKEIYGKDFENTPSAEGMFYHLAWQALYSPHHVALYASGEESGEKKTAVLALKLPDTDTEYLVSNSLRDDTIEAVKFTANHTAITNHIRWVKERSVDDFLEFFRSPFEDAQWPSCWYHSGIDDQRLHNAMRSFFQSQEIDPIGIGKCLFMLHELSGTTTWFHEHHQISELDRPIRRDDLKSVLIALGFHDDQLFPVDLNFKKVFRFPIIPAIPFLLSLRQFVELLKDERYDPRVPYYKKLCFYEIKDASRYGVRLLLHKKRKRSGGIEDVSKPPNLADRFWDSQLVSYVSTAGDEGRLLPALVRLFSCKLFFVRDSNLPWQAFFKGFNIVDGPNQDMPKSTHRFPFLIGVRMNQQHPEICFEWNKLSK